MPVGTSFLSSLLLLLCYITGNKRFSDFEKGIIAGHVNNGWGAQRIADLYGWNKTSVRYHISRFKKTGSMESHISNCGVKRRTDARADRAIALAVVGTPEKRRKSAREVCMELDIDVQERTVRRRLAEQGLHGFVAAKVPHLCPQNVQKRLKWAQDHLSWAIEDWDKVMWSDESPYVIFGGKTRSRVRRREGERLHPHCVDRTVKHGGGKINVWGCFSSKGVGSLTKVNGIMDQHVYKKILVHYARPSADRLGATIFQQDNDPKHTAKTNMSYLTGDRWPVPLMPWPAQSPDLNPIENLWYFLDVQVRKRARKPRNEGELMEALKEEWENLNPQYLKKLVHSMPGRCQAVIDAKGLWTKY